MGLLGSVKDGNWQDLEARARDMLCNILQFRTHPEPSFPRDHSSLISREKLLKCRKPSGVSAKALGSSKLIISRYQIPAEC